MIRPRLLPSLAGALALAAVLKGVTGLGAALAQSEGAVPRPAAVEPQRPAPPPDLLPDVLLDLHRRETELQAQAEALSARAAALAEAEARLAAQIAALDAAERRLEATMALADRAAEDDLLRLTAVFEAMRPEQAAQVVAEMAPEFAAGLIARLRPETAAPILAGVEPRLAYGLSAILAGRNANVPRR
jgi:flagellar motility protein MotE (MotC chaperone)